MITDKRKRELEEMNARNHWSFDKGQLLIFLKVFIDYVNTGLASDLAEEILYRLEDCNFHTFAKLLSNFELEEAAKWIEKEF